MKNRKNDIMAFWFPHILFFWSIYLDANLFVALNKINKKEAYPTGAETL